MEQIFYSILCTTLLPLSMLAMDNSKMFVVKNKSEQDITVYYLRPEGISAYEFLAPEDRKGFFLLKPQNITVHFNSEDRQRNILLGIMDKELVVRQYNVIKMIKHQQPLNNTVEIKEKK